MKGKPKRSPLGRSGGVVIQMKQKYMRVELGTGYCGEDSVQYYKLADQNQIEPTQQDWERYQEMALSHNETYGHEFADWCEEHDLDPDEDNGEYWDEYCIECCEHGYIEIIEADSEDEDDSTFDDGFLEDCEW